MKLIGLAEAAEIALTYLEIASISHLLCLNQEEMKQTKNGAKRNKPLSESELLFLISARDVTYQAGSLPRLFLRFFFASPPLFFQFPSVCHDFSSEVTAYNSLYHKRSGNSFLSLLSNFILHC